MNRLLPFMKWMDELITAIYEMNGWIDYWSVEWIYELIAAMYEMNRWIDDSDIRNEWMNWLLQCMEWMNEFITTIY